MYKETLYFLEPSKINEDVVNYGRIYFGILGRCYIDIAEYSNAPYFQKQHLYLAKNIYKKYFHSERMDIFITIFSAFNKSKENHLNLAAIQFNLLLKGIINLMILLWFIIY